MDSARYVRKARSGSTLKSMPASLSRDLSTAGPARRVSRLEEEGEGQRRGGWMTRSIVPDRSRVCKHTRTIITYAYTYRTSYIAKGRNSSTPASPQKLSSRRLRPFGMFVESTRRHRSPLLRRRRRRRHRRSTESSLPRVFGNYEDLSVRYTRKIQLVNNHDMRYI